MSEKKANINRRTLLKGIAVMPIAIGMLHSESAMAVDVPVDDPSAKALGYTLKSTTAGQTCGNCNFFKGGSAEKGPCLILGGRDVVAAGWCKTWAAVPQ